MKKSILLLFMAFSTLIACNDKARTGGHPEFNAGEAFELKVGNTKKMNGADFTVQFVEVVQESRCPEGVNCIRAGEVIVLLNVNGNPHKMTKNAKENAKKTIDGYTILLTDVMPYPKNRVKVEKSEYKLKMIATRK